MVPWCPWCLMSLALPGCGTSPDGDEPHSALQDYIFYLEPERLESGKGKCPYDPKLDTASALISECSLVLRCGLCLWSGGPWHKHLPQGERASPQPPPVGPHLAGGGVQTPQCELRGRDSIRRCEPPSSPSGGGAEGARSYSEIHSVVLAKARTPQPQAARIRQSKSVSEEV